jgi:hypothetical protein
MAKCVRVENGQVTQIMPFPFEQRGYWLRGSSKVLAELTEAPDHVQPNWRLEDGVFLEPLIIEDEVIESLEGGCCKGPELSESAAQEEKDSGEEVL